MKIYFYRHCDESRLSNPMHNHCDYMVDCVYHGLKRLYGYDCWSNNNLDHMYIDFPNRSTLYGRGFTIYGKLHRTFYQNIDTNTKANKLVFAIHHTKHRNEDAYQKLEELSKHFKKDDISIIDGNDETYILPELKKYGTVYKRELVIDDPDIKPISFAVPKELVINYKTIDKRKNTSDILPQFGGFSTYTFDKEEEYYKEYQHSCFAWTWRKGGWDCMRHYEILMNGCVPFFQDLQLCPYRTMYNFPKSLLSFDKSKNMSWEEYCSLRKELLNYTKKYLTTEKLARYVLWNTQ